MLALTVRLGVARVDGPALRVGECNAARAVGFGLENWGYFNEIQTEDRAPGRQRVSIARVWGRRCRMPAAADLYVAAFTRLSCRWAVRTTRSPPRPLGMGVSVESLKA